MISRRLTSYLAITSFLLIWACSSQNTIEINALDPGRDIQPNESIVFFANEDLAGKNELKRWFVADSLIECTPSCKLEYRWISKDSLEIRGLPAFPSPSYITFDIKKEFFHSDVSDNLESDLSHSFKVARPFVEGITGQWSSTSKTNKNSSILIKVEFNYPINPKEVLEYTRIIINGKEHISSLIKNTAGNELSLQTDLNIQMDSASVIIELDSGFATIDGKFILSKKTPIATMLFAERAIINSQRTGAKKQAHSESNKSVLSEEGGIEDIQRLEQIERAIEEGQESSEILFSKAVSLAKLGKNKESIKVYDQLINSGNKTAANYSNRGVSKNALSLYQSALQDFEKAIALDSNYTMAYVNKGYTLIMLERYIESINALNLALDLDKSNAIALNNKGFAELKIGDLQSATNSLQRSETFNPYNSWLYRNKACLFALANQKDGALLNLEKAINMGYSDKKWIETESSFNSLRNDSKYKEIISKL